MERKFSCRFLSVLLGLLVLFGNDLVGHAQTTTQSVYPAGAGIRVKEVDGSPNVAGVQTLVFPNGTLTRNGQTVTVTVSGGGGTTINSTNGALPYRVNSTTFGDSGITSNARNSTYLDVTSAASGSGVTATVAGGGTNENLNLSGKGLGNVVVLANQLIAPNGTNSAPSYSFSGSANMGMTRGDANNITFIVGGAYGVSIKQTSFTAHSDGRFGLSPSTDTTANPDVGFARIGVNQARIDNGSTGASQLLIGTSTDTVSAQLDVRSQSTTRPGLRVQAASGTSGTQEMLGVYDGSGVLAASFSADGSLRWGSSADTILTRDAANTLAQRNGVNAQTFRLYGTYTDTSNYERLRFAYVSGNFFIGTENAGTGSANGLKLYSQSVVDLFSRGTSTEGWRVSQGNFLALIDNTYDIGQLGANRPKDLYLAGNARIPGFINVGGLLAFNNGIASNIFSATDGNLLLRNSSLTDFDRLQFGGTSASFPALKRSGTTLQFRLADDTAFAAEQSLYIRFGSGTPEGAVTAPVGAIYSRTDGGAGTSLYVKESGSGNTGWVAK